VNLTELITKAKDEWPPIELLEFCGSYYSPYYHFMYLVALEVKGYCVELGCEKGRGLLAMALSGNNVVGFDLNQSPELKLSDYPNITFFQESSLPVNGFFDDKVLGLLHIDTEHTYTQAKNEFEAYKPYFDKPAIIIFDDLHAMNDDVKCFFDELPYEKIQDDEMHPGCGWGVMIYDD